MVNLHLQITKYTKHEHYKKNQSAKISLAKGLSVLRNRTKISRWEIFAAFASSWKLLQQFCRYRCAKPARKEPRNLPWKTSSKLHEKVIAEWNLVVKPSKINLISCLSQQRHELRVENNLMLEKRFRNSWEFCSFWQESQHTDKSAYNSGRAKSCAQY